MFSILSDTMAETVGLVLSGVSLATIFSTCLDCFERIQIGRNFGKDHGEYTLKVNMLWLRFLRWSRSAHLYDWSILPSMEKYHAKRLMEQIHTTFEEVEQQMKKTQPLHSESPSNAEPADRVEVLEASETVRELALKRQRSSSLAQKAKWALYDRDQGDKLISRLTKYIDDLFELVPTSMAQQNFRCDEEVREMMARGGKEVVTTVQDAAAGVDKELGRSIEHAQKTDAQFVQTWKEEKSQGWSTQSNAIEFDGGLPERFQNSHSTWSGQTSFDHSKQFNGYKFVNGKRV